MGRIRTRLGALMAYSGTQNLSKVFLEIALECNRPISLQPFGQVPCRAVCVVAPLANSTGYWLRAARCA